MFRLPQGMSFDFLGTVARFAGGPGKATPGHAYAAFSRYVSPKPARCNASTELLCEYIRAAGKSPDVLDRAFRAAFKEASVACVSSPTGLLLDVPPGDERSSSCESGQLSVRVPGGVTHEETEEFWLHIVRGVYIRALTELHAGSVAGSTHESKEHARRLADVLQQVRGGECFVEDFFYPLYDHVGSSLVYEVPQRVVNALDWLRSLRCADDGHQMRFALVSNYDVRLHHIAKGLSLTDYFETVITTHEAKSIKPDPTGLCMARAKLSAKTGTEEPPRFDSWVHVGDSDADAGAAAAAGCVFCPVLDPTVRQLGADELRLLPREERDQAAEGLIALGPMKRWMFSRYCNPAHHTVRLAHSCHGGRNEPPAQISEK